METVVELITAKVAAAGQVSSLCSSILELAFKIASVQEDWFTVTDEYRSKVAMIDASIRIYRDLMDDRRLLEEDFFLQTLRRAESKLRDEEVKVMKLQGKIQDGQCCGWAWWLWAKVSMVFLPEKLEQNITEVINEISKIPAILSMQEKALSLVQKYDLRQPILTAIHDNDHLYVPLVETQCKVIEAIEQGRRVVLLHGGVGKGKTALARYVFLYYRRSREAGNLFQHVHLESCGHGCVPDNPYTKMLNILRSLSPTALNDSMEKDQSGRLIASAFHNFLKGKRILIILDHVSDSNFLHEMWEAAAQDCPRVKYLVTSQLPNLCNNLNADTIDIAMGATTKDEAMRILASLVGLKSLVIHEDLEEVIVDILEATEGNPLALACLAGHLAYTQDKTSDHAWWEASDNLHNLLDDQEGKIVLGLDYNSPRRSLWQAMDLCMKSLETREAKVIFFLIYACHGGSVPQEILGIWYECINTSSCTFSKAREELRSRELVKLSPGGLKSYLTAKRQDHKLPKYHGVWSLRSLVQLYTKHLTHGENGVMKAEIMNNKIMYAMDSFLNDAQGSVIRHNSSSTLERVESEKAKLAIALCALYFDCSHADQVVMDVVTRARSASNVEDGNFFDQRKASY